MTVERVPVEKIGALGQGLSDLKDDVGALSAEMLRTRTRLHELEKTTAALVHANTAQREAQADSSRRLELRLHMLTAAVAVAGIILPLVFALTGR